MLGGDPAPLPKKEADTLPNFRPMSIVDKLGMEVGLCPNHVVLDGDPVPLPKNGAEPHPGNFWSISIAAIRLDASRS